MSIANFTFMDLKQELMILAVPILFLFFLAVLVATNGLGSTGIICVLIWVLWREPELRNRWWKVIWPWLLVVFIYFVIMSTYSFSRITALRDGLEVLKGITLSIVALYLLQLSEHHLRRAVEYVVIVLMMTVIAILIFNSFEVSIIELFNNHGFDSFVNRNSLAVGFSITAIFIFSLMVDEHSRRKSILWSGLFIFVCFVAFLNGSRGAIVGMFAAMFCIALAALVRVGWKRIFRIELWVLPVLIVFVIISWIVYKHISLNNYFIHDGKNFDTGRFEIWKAVSERIYQAPWLGYGPHAMKFDPMVADVRAKFALTYPHNIYLGLAYASGIIGVLFWYIWFTSFSYKIKENFTKKNKLSNYIGIGLLVNILVHGLVDFDFYKLAPMTYLIVGCTLVAVQSRDIFNATN